MRKKIPQSRKKSQPKVKRTKKVAVPVIEFQPRLPFPIVGIGGSAGGLEAFMLFVKALPADTGMAFIFILHLPPEHDSLLADILSKHTKLPVFPIQHGMEVEPNKIYVSRPDRTVTLRHGTLCLSEPLTNPQHGRPVDDFFRSLAAEQRERAISVIMSGMGSNGSAGAQEIKSVGGLCIAQDPDSAKFPTMPSAFINSGVADFVLRPEQMPETIIRYGRQPYTRGVTVLELKDGEKGALDEIFAILRNGTRHDFSGYKRATVLRRLERRMGLHQINSLSDYLQMLRRLPAEVTALGQEITISVTGFFRDPEVWESLRQKAILPLMRERPAGSTIRAWVTACSSGEEAYTLGMLLLECAASIRKTFDIKIFATDTAERSLSSARTSIFPGGIESDLSPVRLKRFFEKQESVYRVKKEVRELVIFAPQNLMQDPPFSRLDICTCRNLLIYLNPDAQQRVLALIHFGLKENGILLLGNSEAVSGAESLFSPVDKKHRIFRRVGPTRHGAVEFSAALMPEGVTGSENGTVLPLSRIGIAQLSRRLLLEYFSPPAVVIDRQQQIIYFHGNTDRYLEQPRGEPTNDLMALVRKPLRNEIRTAVQRALVHGQPPDVARNPKKPAGGKRREVAVLPVGRGPLPPYFLVVFLDGADPVKNVTRPEIPKHETRRQLMGDLRRARDELQNSLEELQANNEEMRASNEEVVSVNEELQSTNEELETSKEELQSLNEELTSVNAQLQAKMEELEGTTSDLSSLLSSTDIAVIFLDRDLRIRRFTPAITDLLNLIPSDLGRPFSDLDRKFEDAKLLGDAKMVMDRRTPLEAEITNTAGRKFLRRVLPYRAPDSKIDGVVVTFVDITRPTMAESALRGSEERHRLILDGVTEYVIVLLDREGRFATWTPAARQILGYSDAEAIGRHFSLLATAEDNAGGVVDRELQKARETGNSRTERWHVRKDGSLFWATGTISSLKDEFGQLRGFVKLLRDNTERKEQEENLQRAKIEAEAANAAKDTFLANVSHELRTPLATMLLWSKLLAGKEKLDDDQFREGLETIEKSAKDQQALIEDLMDMSRIVSGKLRLEPMPTELTTLVQDSVNSVRATAGVQELSIEAEIAPNLGIAQVDPLRLQQVIWNLLSNAIKFTPPGGSIRVLAVREGNDVQIEVRDTGQGIAADFLPNLFKRFSQMEETTFRNSGGLGLGLSISRQLVELHGGTIAASSDGPGHGATFTIRLPLPDIEDSLPPESSRQPRSDPNALNGVRVLLVEDVDETRKALSVVLSDAGAKVVAVPSAQQALEAFNQGRPDLILSDIGLGKISGHQLIGQIRQLEKAQKSTPVPALAFTAFTDKKNREMALQSGFQRCLNKPVDPDELVSALTDLHTAR